MACDCNKTTYQCPGIEVSSDCVIWRGPAIPLLGICTGDPITYVEEQIIDKINELIKDQDTTLANFNINTCPELRDLLAGKDPSLGNLIQMLWTYGCSLRDLIRQLDQKVDQQISKPPYPFLSKCITPVPIGGRVDTDAFVQGLINKVCELEQSVNSIRPSVETIIRDVLGDMLGSMITSLGGWGLQKSGSGAETKYTILSMVPPLGAIPYMGPVSNFDAAGIGLVGTPYEGWYLLSGLNNLPDARGRTLVGAVNTIPGATLDPAVDPALPQNAGTAYSPGEKFGEHFHKLSIAEMPAHSHPLNDPGHNHAYRGYTSEGRPCGSHCDREDRPTDTRYTSASTTGITIAGAGGDGTHENRQPSLVITGWIVRLP